MLELKLICPVCGLDLNDDCKETHTVSQNFYGDQVFVCEKEQKIFERPIFQGGII